MPFAQFGQISTKLDYTDTKLDYLAIVDGSQFFLQMFGVSRSLIIYWFEFHLSDLYGSIKDLSYLDHSFPSIALCYLIITG